MRINSIPPRELYYQYVHNKGKTAATTSVSGTAKIDTVELTGQAQSFAAAMKSARDALENTENGAKLDSLMKQINSNSYQVSGDKVAERILGKHW